MMQSFSYCQAVVGNTTLDTTTMSTWGSAITSSSDLCDFTKIEIRNGAGHLVKADAPGGEVELFRYECLRDSVVPDCPEEFESEGLVLNRTAIARWLRE